MAYLIRSNIVVSDPEGRFPFYSEFGPAHPDVAMYVRNMAIRGYEITQAEFNLFSSFVSSLVSAGVYDQLLEIYPLFGNSLNSAVVKLKVREGGAFMSPAGSLNASHMEFAGGKVLGKGVTDPASSGAPMLITGIKSGTLLPGAGFHLIAGDVVEGSANQPLMGAMLANPINQVATFAVSASGAEARAGFYASVQNAGAISTVLDVKGMMFSPNPDFVGFSARNKSYHEGELVFNSSYRALADVATDADIALFGQSPYGGATGAGTSAGYSGRIRMAVVSGGFLTDADVSILHAAMRSLGVGLGKL